MSGGSIARLPSGKWRGRVMIHGRTHSITRATKRDVRLAIAELEVAAAGTAPPSDLQFESIVNLWWPRHSRKLAESTRIDYRRVIDHHIIPALGDVAVSKLHQRDLNRLYDDLIGDGLSTSRVRRVHNVIRLVCRYAVNNDLIATSPADKAEPPAVREAVIDPPDPGDVRALFAAAARVDSGFGAFVRLAAVTGARRGELVALRVTDLEHVEIDDDDGRTRRVLVLTIARAVSVAEGDHGVGVNLIEKATKTGHVRRVTLDHATRTILEDHLASLAHRAASHDTELAADHFVFTDALDGAAPWRPEIVSRVFRSTVTDAGLTGVRLHDLRHANATAMMATGVDVKTGSARGGWKRTDQFLNRYAHAMEASDGHAAQAIAAHFDDAG